MLFTLAVVALALGVFRLVTPAGWRLWQQATPAGGDHDRPAAAEPARIELPEPEAGTTVPRVADPVATGVGS